MMKRISTYLLTILLLSGLAFSGCGKQEAPLPFAQEQATPAPVTEELNEYGFASFEWQGPDFNCLFITETVGYTGDTCYSFQTNGMVEHQRYFLETYNWERATRERKELPLAEEISIYGKISCVDTWSDASQWLLFAETDSSGEEILGYSSLKIDAEGNVLSKVKLSEEYFTAEKAVFPSWYRVDNDGYHYVLNGPQKKLYIFSEDGTVQNVIEYAEPFQKGIKACKHAPDNSLYFIVGGMENQTASLCVYEPEKKNFTEQKEFENWAVEHFFVTEEHVYYIMNEKLIKWDRKTGEEKEIFSFLESSIPRNKIESMELATSGDVLLYVKEGETQDIYVLSTKKREAGENGLEIASLTLFDSNYIKGSAASFSRKNPDITVEYNSAEGGDLESYRTRVMAEMVSGEGPDMLWLNAEDLQLFYEKGALQDLNELISEETLEQVFPGIIELGTIEGCYVGLAPEGEASVLMTSNRLWEKEYWSFEEFFGLLEENQPLGILTDTGSVSGWNTGMNLYHTILRYVESSPYLDYEESMSYLQGGEFKQALEAIYLYSGPTKFVYEKDPIMEGGYMAQSCCIIDFSYFSEIMSRYGEDCHFVGYPGQTEDIGNWTAGLLVVNGKSDKKEEISMFLEYLLSEENQKNVDLNSVREDVTRSYLYIDSENNQPYYRHGDGMIRLATKESGESYMEEYIQFLKKCGAFPRTEDAIKDILEEEAQIYFNGQRGLDETVNIMHSRVQLYLDENY